MTAAPRRRRLVAGLVVTALLLLGAEVALRLVVPEEALVFSYERPNGSLMQDPGSGTYLPRPGASGVVPDGPNHWRYRMNAQGLREDEEIPAKKPAGSRRYLALGDSWIWGQSADQTATLDAQLATLLAADGRGPVEVINAGVPGAAAYDMLVRWRALKDLYEIDGVVLGAPKNVGRQQGAAAERALWYQGDGAPYLPIYLYLGARRLLVPYTRARLREVDDDALATMVEDTTLLAREARDAGLSVVLGLWPKDRATAMQNDPGVPYRRFTAALTPLGARVTGARLGSNACWGFEDHSHPSEAGYRVLAEILAERMGDGADPGGLRTTPRCEDVPGIGPTKSDPPRGR